MELYWVVFIFCGSKCFSLFIIPVVLDILFAISSAWLFQLMFLFMMSPRKFKSFTLSIMLSFIFMTGEFIFFCFV